MIWPEESAPAAIRDVENAVDWLDENGGSDVARRMARATVAAERRIVERPLIGRAWAELLVYDARALPPKILRVRHMARDPAPPLAYPRDPAGPEHSP